MSTGNFCHKQHNELPETDVFEKWFSTAPAQRGDSNNSDTI